MCRNSITPCTIKRPIFKVGSANPALWQKRETAFLKRWSLSTKLNGETSQRTLVLIFLSLEPQISLNSVVSLHCIYTFSVLVASHFVSLLCFLLQLLHSFTVTQICFVYDKVLWIIMASKFVRYWTIVTLFFFCSLAYDSRGSPRCSLFWWLNWFFYAALFPFISITTIQWLLYIISIFSFWYFYLNL